MATSVATDAYNCTKEVKELGIKDVVNAGLTTAPTFSTIPPPPSPPPPPPPLSVPNIDLSFPWTRARSFSPPLPANGASSRSSTTASPSPPSPPLSPPSMPSTSCPPRPRLTEHLDGGDGAVAASTDGGEAASMRLTLGGRWGLLSEGLGVLPGRLKVLSCLEGETTWCHGHLLIIELKKRYCTERSLAYRSNHGGTMQIDAFELFVLSILNCGLTHKASVNCELKEVEMEDISEEMYRFYCQTKKYLRTDWPVERDGEEDSVEVLLACPASLAAPLLTYVAAGPRRGCFLDYLNIKPPKKTPCILLGRGVHGSTGSKNPIRIHNKNRIQVTGC